jgi:hypothetical protein
VLQRPLVIAFRDAGSKKTPDSPALRIRFARLRDEAPAPVLVVEQLEVFFLEANRHNTYLLILGHRNSAAHFFEKGRYLKASIL